ncbi:hemerythrin domain-containing protein [Rhizobium sp. 18065]|uniref:hemerythrin domain-containing protein n=1 Tax=Rhizobium sp. 18065 TaxID=2681411 RepID=UPI0013595876|nr:hemerythrin domain-containing protein [Rhizobium sp. 18065]
MKESSGLQPQNIEKLRRNHIDLLKLCSQLEAIADGLPARIDERLCVNVSGTLVSSLERAQALEELILFPLLGQKPGGSNRAVSIEHLVAEHRHDRLAAVEVVHALQTLAAGGCEISPDGTGYMLRGFFECVRRHVAAEQTGLAMLVDEGRRPAVNKIK